MKKVYKIMISSLMVTSFTMQYTAYSGAGAGAGGDSASSSSSSSSSSSPSSSSASSGMQGFNPEATEQLIEACYIDDPAKFEDAVKMAVQSIHDGADVNKIDTIGKTPLYWACLRDNRAMVELLLSNGAQASLNKVYITHRTLLHSACFYKNLELVQLLLGAIDKDGKPALDLSLSANINALHCAINKGELNIVYAILGSDSFNSQNSITVQEILNSLKDQDFVPREREDLFNAHYRALKGYQRVVMITELENYLHPGLK